LIGSLLAFNTSTVMRSEAVVRLLFGRVDYCRGSDDKVRLQYIYIQE